MDTPDDPLCVRCAKHQKTCCQTRAIYVTPGDRRRIGAVVGHDNFVTFEVASPEHLDQADDPTWGQLVFRPDGSRRVLRRKGNGDCLFLGAAGCTLHVETRPLVCRMYPFEYTERGIESELSDGCPTHLMRPHESLLKVLDMRHEDGERWRKQLYQELHEEKLDADRPDLRPQE